MQIKNKKILLITIIITTIILLGIFYSELNPNIFHGGKFGGGGAEGTW